MIYGFNHHNNFDFNKLKSILLAILVIVIGTLCFHFAKDNYITYAPLIEAKLYFLGIVGVIFTKFLFVMLLFMIYGIITVTLCVKVMQLISNFFF